MTVSTPEAIAEQLLRFVRCVYAPTDIIEVRRLPSTRSTWHRAEELPGLAIQLERDSADGQQVYVGANPRTGCGERCATGVTLARCIFVDIDNAKVDEVRFRMREHDLPAPTIIVASGRGVHLYWRLTEPLTDLRLWTSYQRGQASLLGADPAVHDPPRVMRLPGFLNRKHSPPCPCELIEADAARTYELTEFSDALALAPARPVGHDRAHAHSTVTEGNRNTTLTSLAGAMRRHGADVETITDALLSENQRRCKPPLPDAEVRRIGESMERYAPHEPHRGWTPFPVDALPEPLRSFVIEGATAIGCDPSMIAFPTICATAGAIGLSRCVRLRNSWREWSILWVAVIAESGTLKSPAFDLAMEPLRDLQAECFRDYESKMVEFESELLRYEADKADWKRKRKERGDPPEKPTPPICDRFIVHDCTIEALAPILSDNPRGVLLARDELSGWLGSFNQYKQQRGGDGANWLEAHRAGQITIDRKTGVRVIFVPHGGVSVVGTIQPYTLQTALTPEFFACGLAARLLLVAPPRRRKRWSEVDIADSTRQRYANVLRTLAQLMPDVDPKGCPRPCELGFTPEAKGLWIEFYNEFAEEQEEAVGALAAAFAKIEGYAARFALVLQLVQDPSAKSIGRKSMAAGIDLARWVAREAERVYGLLSRSDEDREGALLVELISRRGGRITPRELQQASRRYRRSIKDATNALGQLVENGAGRWVDQPPTCRGGRPTRFFELVNCANGDTTLTGAIVNGGFVDVDTVATGKADVQNPETAVWER